MSDTCKRCRGDGVDRYGEECQLCLGWGYLDSDDYFDADDDPSWDAHKIEWS